ncbi:MAG: 50S ribosomal protein L30e [Candidatus Micrarchaeaceae archaeon]
MSDLTNDLRLAIDTGKVSFGHRSVIRNISSGNAKAVVIASKGRKGIVDDIIHMCEIAKIRAIKFSGNGIELGTACGRPYSVTSLAVIDAGNSQILNQEYA